MGLCERLREITSSQVRHHDIGDQEVNGFTELRRQANRGLPIGSLQHAVSISFEHSARHRPYGRNVFNDEDGLRSPGGLGRGTCRL